MITQEDLLKIIRKESATTLKAMRAFPGDKLPYTPHERSRNAGQLMTNFVFEMYLVKHYVFGEKVDRSVFQTYAPDSSRTLIADFERETAHVVSTIEGMPEADLNKPVEFAGKKMTADEFTLMMMFDQIHHRGQLSVYTRLAGGKVPSAYGPSADDPSTNL